MSENPYQSPPQYVKSGAGGSVPDFERPLGMVAHIPVLATFILCQGGLCVLLGLGCVVMAAIMGSMMVVAPPPPGGAPDGMTPESMGVMMFSIYAGVGAVVGLPGLFMVWSGVQLLRFKGRVLAIISMCVGLVSGLLCYCLPTGIVLLIYGIIVLMNEEVRVAFELRAEGNTFRQVMQHFYGGSSSGNLR